MLEIWTKALTILKATGAPAAEVNALAAKLRALEPDLNESWVVFLNPADDSIWRARLTGEENHDGYLGVEVEYSRFGFDTFDPVCKTWGWWRNDDEWSPEFWFDGTDDEVVDETHYYEYDKNVWRALQKALSHQKREQNAKERDIQKAQA